MNPRHPDVLAVVLAGGRGSRLAPLTDHCAKPALPVFGDYRLVDVVLSNLSHSRIRDVWIVEQYLPHSINDHLSNGRPWDLDRTTGGLVVLPPFEGTDGEGFAEGNADALARQIGLIEAAGHDLVLVASADHLYTLDARDLVDTHVREGAALTMVTTTAADDPSRHGVVQVDDDGRITDFAYKPDEPHGNVVAAEIFLYDAAVLIEAVRGLVDAGEELADYGDSIVPWVLDRHRCVEHRLTGYWRDVGTVQSYHRAHRDLLAGTAVDFADPRWPVLTSTREPHPARVEAGATVAGSLLGGACRVAGSVTDAVIGPRCVVEAGAEVTDAVLGPGVVVRAGAVVRHAVVAAGAEVTGRVVGDPDTVVVVDRDGEVHVPADE